MRRVIGVLALTVLAGCAVSRPTIRPIMSVQQDSAGAAVAVAAPAAMVSPTREVIMPVSRVEVPRLDCRGKLSSSDELSRSMVEQRVREGAYYAALAQIQTLPVENASVAALRADILRRLNDPEAADWLRALQGTTCMVGRAEHGLGLLAAQQGDERAALAHLAAAASKLPADASVRNDLGFLYLSMGQDAQAEFELRTASELAPDDRLPAFNLAVLALVRGDVANWISSRDRLQFTAAEKLELDRSCRRVMRRRMATVGVPACLIDVSR